MTGNALSGKGWGTVQSPEEPQIVQVFKYEAIRVYVFRTRKIKTALITFDDQVYAYVNLTHPYDFASELVRKAYSQWELESEVHYSNPFKELLQNKQALEKLRQILTEIYSSGA